jgi:F-box-like
MACLISLPHEILHNVFAEVDSVDLAALSATCRAFHGFIRRNRCLFKELYLKTFVCHLILHLPWLPDREQDNRPRAAGGSEPAWEELLPRLVRLQKILDSSDSSIKVFSSSP